MADNDDRVPMATIAPKSEPQVHWMPEPSSRFYDAAQKALRDAYAMGKQEGEIELVKLRAVADAAARVRAERVAFLASLAVPCAVRSDGLELAEAEMDAALDAWEKGRTT